MVMREKVLKEQTSLDQQRAEVKSMDAELERKRAALDPADEAGSRHCRTKRCGESNR